MGAGRIFARVGKVEILSDEEAIFYRASMPDFIVWFAGEVLVEDAMDVMP